MLDKEVGHHWSTQYVASYTESSKAVFDGENGLSVAFGIASHPNSEISEVNEKLEKYDAKIATMNAYFIREGYQSNRERQKVPVALHPCDPVELFRNFYSASRDHSA